MAGGGAIVGSDKFWAGVDQAFAENPLVEFMVGALNVAFGVG